MEENEEITPARFASIIAEQISTKRVTSYPLAVDCEPPALFLLNFIGLESAVITGTKIA